MSKRLKLTVAGTRRPMQVAATNRHVADLVFGDPESAERVAIIVHSDEQGDTSKAAVLAMAERVARAANAHDDLLAACREALIWIEEMDGEGSLAYSLLESAVAKATLKSSWE